MSLIEMSLIWGVCKSPKQKRSFIFTKTVLRGEVLKTSFRHYFGTLKTFLVQNKHLKRYFKFLFCFEVYDTKNLEVLKTFEEHSEECFPYAETHRYGLLLFLGTFLKHFILNIQRGFLKNALRLLNINRCSWGKSSRIMKLNTMKNILYK